MLSDTTPQSAETVGGRPDRIVVRGLIVDAFIGIHDEERLARQRLRFDVEVETVDRYAEIVRTTGSYVSYADIVGFIDDRAKLGEHVDLVETWADDVASYVLTNELAAVVRVSVTKPDIFDHADGVGVAIERRRPESRRS